VAVRGRYIDPTEHVGGRILLSLVVSPYFQLCISLPTIPTQASLFYVATPLVLHHKATTIVSKLKKKEEKITKKPILR
jgi:hypothetical protein